MIPKRPGRLRPAFLTILGMTTLLALLPGGGPARAASLDLAGADLTELSLEQLSTVSVYSASKFEQKITEAPSSISVVSGDEIRKHGYRTLADLLRGVRGFYVTYDRNYTAIGVRGFAQPGDLSTRVLLMVDGHRVNDGLYESAASGTEFILDMDLIDRVEIVRGPSSSLYGSNAFFGVINVITRKATDFGGGELSGEVASFETTKGRATYGRKFDSGLEAVVSGTRFRSEGQTLFFPEFNDPATNNGVADHRDADRADTFFSALSYEGVTLQAAGITRTKDIPTGAYGSLFNDPRNKSVDDRFYADAKVDRDLGPDTHLSARAFYDWYAYRGDFVFADNAVNPVSPFLYINKDRAVTDWWGSELTLTRKMFDGHRITAGGELRNYSRQNQRNFNDVTPVQVKLDDRRRMRIWALYLQDEYQVTPGLMLNLGIRHDQYSTFGSTLNPRGALIWNPRKETTVKLLYGTAFRAPDPYEMFYNDGGITQKSSSNLRPEKIRTYEGVIEQSIGPNLRIGASAYYYKLTDLISQVTDPVDNLLVFRNGATIRARGIEVEVEGRWENGLSGRASYTIQRNQDEQGAGVTNSPRQMAKFEGIIPILAGKVFAGGDTQYMSSRRSPGGATARPYYVVNVTLYGRKLLGGLDASVSAYNLLDYRYGDPTGNKLPEDILPQDGRSFRGKLTYSF